MHLDTMFIWFLMVVFAAFFFVLTFVAQYLLRIARACEWLAEQGAEECECEDCNFEEIDEDGNGRSA